MFRALFLFLLLFPIPVSAQPPTWYVIARHDGCHELQVLVKMMNLKRAPVSPEDFAQMMRERGEQVVIGPLTEAPNEIQPDIIGKIVQVQVGKRAAPIFVTEEICRNIDRVR
jgi:hypothetical protein